MNRKLDVPIQANAVGQVLESSGMECHTDVLDEEEQEPPSYGPDLYE